MVASVELGKTAGNFLPGEEQVQQDSVDVYQYLMLENKDVEAIFFSVTLKKRQGGSMQKLKSRKS